MALAAIALGNIPIERMSSASAAVAYSVPITDNMAPGAVTSAAIIGAVMLSPSLMLPEDRSVLAADEAGIAMKAMLDAKPPAAMLIITAT